MDSAIRPRRASNRRRRTMAFAAAASVTCLYGCSDLFNPSFLQLFSSPDDPESGFAAVQAPVGHIPILFDNDARFSDNVFRFVIQGDPIVREEVVDEILRENPQLTNEQIEQLLQDIIDDQPVQLEEINLPPRVRLTVQVTNVDGGTQILEFLDGLRLVREENEDFGGAALPPDLSENTNDTFIVQCEVAQIQIVSIEVFIPVVLRVTQNLFDENGFPVGEECIEFNVPQFRLLLPDMGLADDSFNDLRNFDPRFFPPPLQDLQCGAVVVLQLTGSLSLPFRDVPPNCEPANNPPADGLVPAYLNTDQVAENQIPGRYGISISVRDQ